MNFRTSSLVSPPVSSGAVCMGGIGWTQTLLPMPMSLDATTGDVMCRVWLGIDRLASGRPSNPHAAPYLSAASPDGVRWRVVRRPILAVIGSGVEGLAPHGSIPCLPHINFSLLREFIIATASLSRSGSPALRACQVSRMTDCAKAVVGRLQAQEVSNDLAHYTKSATVRSRVAPGQQNRCRKLEVGCLGGALRPTVSPA